jgi:hypothetical protein
MPLDALPLSPLHVRSGSFATEPFSARADQCPLLSNNGQIVAVPRLSALCQKQTHAPQQTASLFDYFVGNSEECLRDGETKRLRRFEVDDQIELGGRLNRKVLRLCTSKNSINIGCRLSIDF